MTVINHYGKYVNSEEPITGVINNYSLEWIWEEQDKGIDLAFEEHLNSEEHIEEGICQICEFWEYSDNYLIGGWIKDAVTGLYEEDKNSEYSAILRTDSNVTQVVWSKYTKRVKLCSPCYPGQGDLDSPDNDGYLAYDMPPDVYGNVDL